MDIKEIKHKQSNIDTVTTDTYTYEWKGPVRLEGLWGSTKATMEDCSLTLHVTNKGETMFMELEAGDEFAEIGLEIFDGEVQGYDGVISFPPQAVEMFDAVGIKYDPSLKDE